MGKINEYEKEMLRRENIRPCGSFLPEEYVIKVERKPEPGEREPREELYLPAGARLKWFQTYCQENGLKYRIDESEAEYIPSLSCIKATCHVWLNGEEVASSSAGYYLDKSAPRDEVQKAFQTAATTARGRTLALLGFNLTGEFASGDIPGACDTGVVICSEESEPAEPKKRTRRKKETPVKEPVAPETAAMPEPEREEPACAEAPVEFSVETPAELPVKVESRKEPAELPVKAAAPVEPELPPMPEAPAKPATPAKPEVSVSDEIPATYDEAVAYPVPERFRATLPATVGEALAAGKERELRYFASNGAKFSQYRGFCEAAALALKGDPYEGMMDAACPF